MSESDFIIVVYCFVEEFYTDVVREKKIRQRGPRPALLDVEVLTLLIVGEYLGLGSDKKIWHYFKRHYQAWFPKLGCRTSFVRQSANLMGIVQSIHTKISTHLTHGKDLYLFDGFPIPVCHIKRYKRSSPFRGEGAVGYCASKDQTYFGFKGHLLISQQGVAKVLSVTPAHVDEKRCNDFQGKYFTF